MRGMLENLLVARPEDKGIPHRISGAPDRRYILREGRKQMAVADIGHWPHRSDLRHQFFLPHPHAFFAHSYQKRVRANTWLDSRLFAVHGIFSGRQILRHRRKMNLLIAGYYGSGNAGDEALLQALLAALKSRLDYDVTVISSDP